MQTAASAIRAVVVGVVNVFEKGGFEFGVIHVEHPTRQDEAKGWGFLFNNRYTQLSSQILRLATLRAKAGALLSEECATALEELARKARGLHFMFQQKVEHIRVGPDIVAQYPDQGWVKRVNESVQAIPDDRTDAFSLEFEEKFQTLMKLVKPFI